MEHEFKPKDNPGSIFSENDLKPNEYIKHIRFARIILYVLAGLQLFSLFILPYQEENTRIFTICTGIFISILFIGLALWSIKDPGKAILTGLIFYAGIILINVIIEPQSLVKGIGIKVIAILLLFNGYRNARESKKLEVEISIDKRLDS